MLKYSLVLLAATTAFLFNGCESECCQSGEVGPVAVIDGLTSSGSFTGDSFPLSRSGSSDSDGTTSSSDDVWTVDGTEVAVGYILPVGTHNVCLTVTDNDGYTDQTCANVTINAATVPDNVRPVARVGVVPDTKCEPGNPVSINSDGSSDPDGSIASYIWNQSSIGAAANGQVTCPAYGTSLDVCLKVADTQGLESLQVCEAVTAVDAPTTLPPVAIIAEDTTQGDNGCDLTAGAPYIDNKAKYLSCGTSHDNDNIDPNPDKGRTDTSIVKCVWNVSVYITGVENPHAETYVTFLTDGGVDIANSTADDPKWMGHEGDYKIITLTVFDDDDQNDTVTKKLDYSIGACGGLVDP